MKRAIFRYIVVNYKLIFFFVVLINTQLVGENLYTHRYKTKLY